MCGIVGYIGNKNANNILIKGLYKLEYRGYDSAGIAILDGNTIATLKKQGRVKNLENQEMFNSLNGNIGIAHTRWATHGVPSDVNAHPHSDTNNLFSVVHNGIIENYAELKKFLISKSYTFKSETDTEVIVNLISYYYSLEKEGSTLDKVKSALNKALKELQGSYAIGLLCKDLKDTLIVAKKDSPLVIAQADSEFYVSSDIPAILEYSRNFYFLNDYNLAIIQKNNIEFYDYSKDFKKIDLELQDISWNADSSEKGDFEDYMLKEIFEQGRAVRETISTYLNSEKISLPIEFDKDYLNKINKIYIVACGTALHAGRSVKYDFEQLLQINVIPEFASEFRYSPTLVDENTLCIFISQSGETADTIAALKLAKEKGAKTLAIVNAIGSTITRLADYTLYTHAGPEIAVASTKAYTCQITLLKILAMFMYENKFDRTIDENIKKQLKEIPSKIDETLKLNDDVKALANIIKDHKNCFFIGRISDYITAMEASLKLKEISYINSESYPAGELKHGPIALIENGTPVIGIATNHQAHKTMSNLEEVMARGANVIYITNKDISSTKIQHILRIPDVDDSLASIISIIPLQLLSYHTAKFLNYDVDKPRNLAKSVTVE